MLVVLVVSVALNVCFVFFILKLKKDFHLGSECDGGCEAIKEKVRSLEYLLRQGEG